MQECGAPLQVEAVGPSDAGMAMERQRVAGAVSVQPRASESEEPVRWSTGLPPAGERTAEPSRV
jgi:hypothetical protein